MKLSEIKGENAIDVLADIIEPATMIMADKEVKTMWNKLPKVKFASFILKKHKKEVLKIASILQGCQEDEINILTLPKLVIDAFNDEELLSLFTSASESNQDASFGSPMPNIKATENL